MARCNYWHILFSFPTSTLSTQSRFLQPYEIFQSVLIIWRREKTPREKTRHSIIIYIMHAFHLFPFFYCENGSHTQPVSLFLTFPNLPKIEILSHIQKFVFFSTCNIIILSPQVDILLFCLVERKIISSTLKCLAHKTTTTYLQTPLPVYFSPSLPALLRNPLLHIFNFHIHSDSSPLSLMRLPRRGACLLPALSLCGCIITIMWVKVAYKSINLLPFHVLI